jgi:hypothetical protein
MALDSDAATSADPPPAEAARCSARGCQELAEVELQWRNPALHDGARIKVWAACADHTESLAGFLRRRNFLLATVPIAPTAPTEVD